MKIRFGDSTRKLRGSPMGGVLALVTGSAAGQALALLSAPLLSRLYAPDAFGIFSYLFSVSAVLTAIASFRYEQAVPLACDLDEARALTRASLSLAAGFAIVTAGVVAVWHTPFSHAVGFEVLPWAWWLPALIVLTSWFNTLTQAAIRQRAYSAIAATTFMQNVGVATGQLGFAAFTRSAGGLLSGQLVGRSFGILALAKTSRELLPRPPRGTLRATARKFWRFPAVLAPSALLNTLGTSLPLILIGAWFGPQAAGFLGLTQRIAMAPTALVAVAVGQVFSGELSSRLRAGQIDNRRLYLRTSCRLATGGLAVAVVLLLISDWAFPIILGSRWANSGGYAQAIALSVGAGFVVSPVSFVFIAYQRVVSNIVVDLSRVLLVAGLGAIAYFIGLSAVHTVWAMTIGQVVNYALTWAMGLVIVRGRHPSKWRRRPGPNTTLPEPGRTSLDKHGG